MHRLPQGEPRSGSDDLLGDLVAKAWQGARGETGAHDLPERKTDMRKFSKATVAIGTAGILVASAGAAYAYWTTTGSGSGSAAASSGAGTVTLHASFPTAALAPGAANAQAVAYTADNANTYSTKVGALTVTSVTVDSTHATNGCLAADFSATAVTSNTTVAASSTGTSVGSGTITMADTAADQSACKGATITINVTSI